MSAFKQPSGSNKALITHVFTRKAKVITEAQREAMNGIVKARKGIEKRESDKSIMSVGDAYYDDLEREF